MKISNQVQLSFDDVLLTPKFSRVKSRADVDISVDFCGRKLGIGIISSNMDTVTEVAMAKAMHAGGAIGALHRFCSVQDNIRMFLESECQPIVSVGIGKAELERAEALASVGANIILVDVAHGAAMHVVEHVRELRKLVHHSTQIIVGNFADADGIDDFNYHLGGSVAAYKVGIGGGSACLTRVVTGSGLPSLASIIDCSRTGFPIIADGGIRNSGDFAKAIAAGATTVMMGRLFAGCEESPSEKVWKNHKGEILPKHVVFPSKNVNGKLVLMENYPVDLPAFKKYRGSASTESYQVQGKVAQHRSYEGDSYYIPYTGPVANVLQQFEGGLRSALSYSGAFNIAEFREKAEFVQVTPGGAKESGSHGRSSV